MSLSTDQFMELLSGGRETRGVEFKAAGPRGDPLVFAFVARAVLAMSNLQLGGWVLLGIQDDGQMSGISLAPTMGRELFSDFPRRMLLPGYKADIDRVRVPIEVTRTELVASIDDLTAATANRVFGECGFTPMANILKEFVAEVRR